MLVKLFLTLLTLLPVLAINSCKTSIKNNGNKNMESEILAELDLAFKGIPGKFYPIILRNCIKYNFFLDLEHPYFLTAGNKIHLFADSTRWAIIFEINGYYTRSFSPQFQLLYVGNCVDYFIDDYDGNTYASNMKFIPLINDIELKRIEDKSEMGSELIDKNTKEITIKNKTILFENDYTKYEKLGIKIGDSSTNKLIGFRELVRYLQETNPEILSANENDLRTIIPKDIPKLMSISAYNYSSFYNKNKPPSNQETFKLIAKILASRNTKKWKPTLKPNNHWSNWESGNL